MQKLAKFNINIKLKQSAIGGSVLSLYIYSDYFDLYNPGKLEAMIKGTALFGRANQGIILGLSSILLVTSFMICLSVSLPAVINRIINIVDGLIMTLMMGFIFYLIGWYFYKMYAAVEAILTLLITWYAWNWPRESNT